MDDCIELYDRSTLSDSDSNIIETFFGSGFILIPKLIELS